MAENPVELDVEVAVESNTFADAQGPTTTGSAASTRGASMRRPLSDTVLGIESDHAYFPTANSTKMS